MAEKNIIDGVEYETEPHCFDGPENAAVYYATDIPKKIRRGGLSGLFDLDAQELDTLSPFDRLKRGAQSWHYWVQAHEDRWIKTTQDEEGNQFKRWKTENEIDEEYRQINFADGQKTDADGRYTIGGFDAGRFVFPCAVNFDTAIFNEDIKFDAAIFTNEASFNGATFSGKSEFEGATFSGKSGFEGAAFSGEAGFERARFSGRAWFWGTRFSGEASFHEATFSGGAWFKGVTFSGGALFRRAAFSGTTSFDGVTFCGTASFRGAKFSGAASFEGARFSGEAWFKGARFGGEAWFKGARFSGGALFRGARFSGAASFDGARFSGAASFNEARFERRLSIQRVVFFGEAQWGDGQFNSSVSFSHSQFLSGAAFPNVKIEGQADFDHVHFGKGEGTPKPDQYEKWDTETRQTYDAATVKPDSLTIPDFRGTQFKIPPNLGYTHVPSPPAQFLAWHERLFAEDGLPPEQRKISDENAGSKLRRLGDLAKQGHHHLAEKRFFRAELLTRRGHETIKWQEIAMINAFERFSACGLLIRRPLGWLLLVTVLSALFYYSQIDWPAGDSGMFELASYSFANSLPLLGYISDSYEVSVNVLFGGVDKVPGIVRVWAFFQNLVSAVFIFFALLAVRNYFKLG